MLKLLPYSFRNWKSESLLQDRHRVVTNIYVPFGSLRDQSFFLPYHMARCFLYGKISPVFLLSSTTLVWLFKTHPLILFSLLVTEDYCGTQWLIQLTPISKCLICKIFSYLSGEGRVYREAVALCFLNPSGVSFFTTKWHGLHVTTPHLHFWTAFKALILKKSCLWGKAFFVGHLILFKLNLVV